MSYQGDDPNRRRERQRTGTPQRQPQTGQPQTGQGQPSQWQGQPQQTPGHQPQTQFTQGSGGGQRQPGGGQRPGRQGPSGQQSSVPQGGMQPGGGQQSSGYQQQRTQQPQSGSQVRTQGAVQPGQFTQQASMVQSAPRGRGGGIGAPQQRQRARLAPSRVEEVISTDLVTATRDTPLATVAAMMNENDVGCVIVVDDEETPVGVLTDRKIALAVESEPEIGRRTAEELVSSELLTGQTDMTVFEALDKLNEAGVRRLPIVDEEGTLTGIVTLDDLLVLLGTNLGDAAEVIASQTRRS